jgi:CHAT domain-containing protein/tetratricopeptide (TPR) repeat protein
MARTLIASIGQLILLLALLLPSAATAQTAAELDALDDQVEQLFNQRQYADALPIAERVLAGRERVLGADHAETLTAVNNLAEVHRVLGHYTEAEPLHRRALEGRERALGPEHEDTLASADRLARLYNDLGRYGEAEPLYLRALQARERLLGPDHPATLISANNLGWLYATQGRYAEAEPLYRRAFETQERVLGAEHSATLKSLNNLAGLYHDMGRRSAAEPLYRRAMETQTRTLGPEHPDTLVSTSNLASLYRDQGRAAEAEPLFRRVLEVRERVLGQEHPKTLITVGNLADTYLKERRYRDAEALFCRALEAQARTLGPDHPSTLDSVNNLAFTYNAEGRKAEAEPLYRRTLETRERVLGPEHPSTLISVNNLAMLYDTQHRYALAEPLYRRALEAQTRTLGPDHPLTLTSAHNLAAAYEAQGRYGEAGELYRRVLDGRARVLGNEHPDTLHTLNNLAAFYFAERDWSRAAEYWRRSTAAIAGRTWRGTQDTGLKGKQKSEAEQESWQFSLLVQAAYRLAPEGGAGAAISREMFQTAQWALSSEAAQSLAQMAARSAKGGGPLAVLVRERQDLLAEWQRRNAFRDAALGLDAAKRDAAAEETNKSTIAGIERRLAEIDERLAKDFPDYAALASPKPLSVEEVQAQLHTEEALVLFFDVRERFSGVAPEETFIWIVTSNSVRWLRSGLGTAALAREVQALRCGLDQQAWSGSHCDGLAGAGYTKADVNAGKPLPFDLGRAHKLYAALFGGAEDLIKGKHLLIVPSGPLTQLPFQVLVTAPPKGREYKSAAWLMRGHAITVLPAVSSLNALRRVAKPSGAKKTMIGFGNPLLEGPDYRYAELARLARNNERCPDTRSLRVATLSRARSSVALLQTGNGLADISFIRNAVPLPETAGELCAVARDLGVDPGEIRLGGRATEREVKRLSESGELAQYRIVHFATHGALAGKVTGKAEPGLLLTPPAEASEVDDGYLTASEVAALKLDADWVILSACNTAAGGAIGSEALSGLARAFFYAQARALLVSHWEVNSAATVRLITSGVSAMRRDPRIGGAEALRRAMIAMIETGKPFEAHPSYWAPFVLVGEGGAAK